MEGQAGETNNDQHVIPSSEIILVSPALDVAAHSMIDALNGALMAMMRRRWPTEAIALAPLVITLVIKVAAFSGKISNRHSKTRI
jgi:hypothetical protein